MGRGDDGLSKATTEATVSHEIEEPTMPSPIGSEVDSTPRPLPARVSIRGQYASLEPLHRRHAFELWQAA